MKTTETRTAIIETYDFTLPQWTACPLVNADTSGISETEEKQLEDFQESLMELVAKNNGKHYTIEWISDEPYFSHHNDMDSLGGDVYDVKVHIFGEVDTYKVMALEHALICAIWSHLDDNSEALEISYDITDIKDLGVFRSNLWSFIDNCRDILERCDISAEQCGHDFWLTSNGHGAGFWDRGHGEDGDTLTEFCCVSYDVYVTDNGYLAIS